MIGIIEGFYASKTNEPAALQGFLFPSGRVRVEFLGEGGKYTAETRWESLGEFVKGMRTYREDFQVVIYQPQHTVSYSMKALKVDLSPTAEEPMPRPPSNGHLGAVEA